MNNLIYLIESVKNHPKLFTNTISNDEQDDTKEWAAVAEECKMSIAVAQEKWNQLLLEYVDYLRSNQDFSLAKHMDFLQPYFFTIIDHENIDEDELLNAIDSKKIDEIAVNEVLLKKENSSEKEAVDNGKTVKIEQQTKEMDLVTPFASSNQNEHSISKDISLKSSTAPQNTTSSFTSLTSLELIFLGYAKQLQKMPISLQLKTKRKIADIMEEAEFEMIS